jgi:hypothetical protein
MAYIPTTASESGEAFPVGAVFIGVVSTNPASLLGYGTWSAFGAGKVLVGRDANDTDFDVAEETGGAKTKAISAHAGSAVGDHAAHTHSVTSNVAVGDHTGLTHSGTAVADHGSHTHTYTQVPNHVHVERVQGGTTASTTGTHIMTSAATGGSLRSSAASTLDPTGGVATGTTNGPGAILTHSVTQPSAHGTAGTVAHSVTNNAVTSGNPSATLSHSVTQPSAHTDLNVVQPYIVVYMWKRTA